MKIGINLISLPSEKGSGAFRYIQLMLKAMGEYEIRNCSFVVYKQKHISETYLGIPESLNVEYVNVPTLGQGMKRVLFEQTLFYFYLKKCDVLYSYCTSMPLLARARKIFTLHDVYYLILKERYGFWQRNYLKYMTKLYVRKCQHILTVSEYSKKSISDFLKVDKNKITITYNFLESNTPVYHNMSMSDIKDVHDNSLEGVKSFFLYVGNLQPGKNIKRMVDGYLQYTSQSSPYLLIVGKPTTDGQSLVDYIEGKAKVIYLGYTERNVLEFLLSKCKAIILLSLCEGFGIPPLEGFQYGKPALVSDRTSLPEIVGKAGVIVNPEDIRSIAKGFKKVEDFTEEQKKGIIEQLIKFDKKTSVETFMQTLGIEFLHKNKHES